jgi:hypothetical protein
MQEYIKLFRIIHIYNNAASTIFVMSKHSLAATIGAITSIPFNGSRQLDMLIVSGRYLDPATINGLVALDDVSPLLSTASDSDSHC